MIIVGDIGGTKTVLAVFSAAAGPHKPLVEKTYSSRQYASLEEIIQAFLAEIDLPVSAGCFGVAGPVLSGRAQITNLPWVIDESNLKAAFGWGSVRLLNDLEALAYAVPILEPADVFTLNTGVPLPRGNIAVLAPGTGLGEAFLTYGETRYHAHASEGSHASFAPADRLQDGLLTYLRDQKGYEHVSFERVCSGRLGIPNIYAYLISIQYAEEPVWLVDKLASSSDPTPIILAAAQDKQEPCALCSAVLELFVNILGSEAGNLALKMLSTGGIYLGGGIPPRILDELRQPGFLHALTNKGRFSEMLSRVPVYVILNDRAGLMGAAAYGLLLRD